MKIYRKTSELDNEEQFLYPSYEKSDAVKQAEAQAQQYAANQPADYRSQYQDQMNDLLTQIQNRPEFQYDADGDALYQRYKDYYTRNGQRAMQDTMGQAAALTGGYGSSYAQNVGQQAYNEYMTRLTDVIPELYQLALDRYDRETANLQDQYAMYANLDAQDYSRWQDQRSLYYTELDRLTDNARYEAEQDWNRYAAGYDAAYDKYQQDLANRPEYTAVIVDGENNNGSVSHESIKTMQRLLGLPEDGYWGSAAYEAAGNLTAEKAWDAYLQGKLFGKSRSGMTMEEWAAQKQGKAETPSKAIYADWTAGEWEGYFAAIRQEEGQAAAEEELNYLASKGYIPTNMVSYAAIGARGGAVGH